MRCVLRRALAAHSASQDALRSCKLATPAKRSWGDVCVSIRIRPPPPDLLGSTSWPAPLSYGCACGQTPWGSPVNCLAGCLLLPDLPSRPPEGTMLLQDKLSRGTLSLSRCIDCHQCVAVSIDITHLAPQQDFQARKGGESCSASAVISRPLRAGHRGRIQAEATLGFIRRARLLVHVQWPSEPLSTACPSCGGGGGEGIPKTPQPPNGSFYFLLRALL